MKRAIPCGLASAIAISAPALAEVPQVATDIAPVHSLVAQVMGDLGAPELILPPGVSPHHYSLKPSQARSLSKADVVFWVGEQLTPWLADTLETLSGDAETVKLLETPGARLHQFRENAIFEQDDHDEQGQDDHADHAAEDAADHAGHDAHGHEDHADEHHDEHAAETYAQGHDDHDHAHGGTDPHIWLDPVNAAASIKVIAHVLSEADPENAATYAANAEAAQAGLAALTAEIETRLEPVRGLRFVVFHDAYQYFEKAFGLPAMGAISLGDATDPGAGRIAALRELVREGEVNCLAAEPQYDPAMIKTLASGAEIPTTVLDPLGIDIEPGQEFYGRLLQSLTDSLLACE